MASRKARSQAATLRRAARYLMTQAAGRSEEYDWSMYQLRRRVPEAFEVLKALGYHKQGWLAPMDLLGLADQLTDPTLPRP